MAAAYIPEIISISDDEEAARVIVNLIDTFDAIGDVDWRQDLPPSQFELNDFLTESVAVSKEEQLEKENSHLRRQLQFEREGNIQLQQQITELQAFEAHKHVEHNKNIDFMQRDSARMLKAAKEESDACQMREAVKAQQEIFARDNQIEHQQQLLLQHERESANNERALYLRIDELKQVIEKQECLVQSQHLKIEEQERLIAYQRRRLDQMPSLSGVASGEGENNLIPEDHPEWSIFLDTTDKYMPDFVGHFLFDVEFEYMPGQVARVVKAMTKLPGTLSGSEKYVKYNGQRMYPRKLRQGLRLPIS